MTYDETNIKRLVKMAQDAASEAQLKANWAIRILDQLLNEIATEENKKRLPKYGNPPPMYGDLPVAGSEPSTSARYATGGFA